MAISVGDKVAFLNAVGGGTVVAIKDKNTFMVSDEHGFLIPCRSNELVLISAQKSMGKQEELALAPTNNQQQIALHYIPVKNQEITLSDLDMVISNHCGCEILYTIYNCAKGQMIGSGKLGNHGLIQIKTIPRAQLEQFCNLHFQAIILTPNNSQPIEPLNCPIAVKPTILYQAGAFLFAEAIQRIAYTVLLGDLLDDKKNGVKNPEIYPLQIKDALFEKQTKASIRHHSTRKEEEVDLHIHELIENSSGINPAGLLEIQLNHFKKCMDRAIAEHHYSITFIHGVGKGTLKQELTKLLESYDGIKFYPANYQRYGHGAIKVEII